MGGPDGTWSIALNPFSQDELTDEDLANDVLFYMRPDGHPVRAARLFLGHIHETILREIADHFHVDPQTLKKYKLDSHLFSLVSSSKPAFHLNPLPYHRLQPSETLWSILPTPAYAYHQLIWELVQEQMQAIKRCAGSTEIMGYFWMVDLQKKIFLNACWPGHFVIPLCGVPSCQSDRR